MEYVALFFVYLPSDERCKAAAGVSPVQFLFKFFHRPLKNKQMNNTRESYNV